MLVKFICKYFTQIIKLQHNYPYKILEVLMGTNGSSFLFIGFFSHAMLFSFCSNSGLDREMLVISNVFLNQKNQFFFFFDRKGLT